MNDLQAVHDGVPVYASTFTLRGNLAFRCACGEIHVHGAAQGAGHRGAHCQHHRTTGVHLLLPETLQ